MPEEISGFFFKTNKREEGLNGYRTHSNQIIFTGFCYSLPRVREPKLSRPLFFFFWQSDSDPQCLSGHFRLGLSIFGEKKHFFLFKLSIHPQSIINLTDKKRGTNSHTSIFLNGIMWSDEPRLCVSFTQHICQKIKINENLHDFFI